MLYFIHFNVFLDFLEKNFLETSSLNHGLLRNVLLGEMNEIENSKAIEKKTMKEKNGFLKIPN